MTEQRERAASQSPGQFEAENRPAGQPAGLHLVTGLVGDRRAALRPSHQMFAPFCWAWRRQDGWGDNEHRDYWQHHLHAWPAVKRSSSEVLAFAMRAARARGLDEEDFAYRLGAIATGQALGHASADDVRRQLRRSHNGRRLRDVPEFGEPVITGYVLPRVWADHEAPPNPHTYMNLDREFIDAAAPPDPRVKRIKAALVEARARR